jgi:hypothetical protein
MSRSESQAHGRCLLDVSHADVDAELLRQLKKL